ncbi:MAG: galactokinase [Rikenellaceae bacterium]
MQNRVHEAFVSRFESEGTVYAASGRINLIGEHTDYNEGFVFPGAIEQGIIAEIKPSGTNKVRAYAIDFDDYAEFEIGQAELPEQGWLRYIYGVCCEVIKRDGKVEGFDTAFSGSVPAGAGLSSSAALESVFGFAINDLFNDNAIDKMELARIGQATEHNYIGVKCGIMDQFASIFGKKDHLIRLDCRSMEYAYFPFDAKGYKLVLVNSKVKHELVDSPYNKRRESCERVAATLGRPSLRGASFADLEAVKDQVSEEDYMRATFVIGEEQRVLDVCEALEAGDMERAGKDIYATHVGLSRDYEVSCVEIDFLVDIARECGVTGSRIMGGGFGGCTINLVKDELYDNFIAIAIEKFKAEYGIEPEIIPVVINDGARRISE